MTGFEFVDLTMVSSSGFQILNVVSNPPETSIPSAAVKQETVPVCPLSMPIEDMSERLHNVIMLLLPEVAKNSLPSNCAAKSLPDWRGNRIAAPGSVGSVKQIR